jgi:peroxiredoxin
MLFKEPQMAATTVAEQVSTLKATTAEQPTNDLMSAFTREQGELALLRTPDGVIDVGAILSDARLLDPLSRHTTLYDVLADRPAVVVFYRGAWCPYCNIALRTYQSELLAELTRRGVALVAISPQAPDGSLSMAEKNDLALTILSDPGNALAKSVGILTAPSPDARGAQLKLGLDLTAVNADGTTGLPMPTTLIVDAGHLVRWVDVHPDYTARSEPVEILEALDATLSG